jgi:Protein of unknown function (DUF3987)/Bifunctional DNA primase/polymerase, N-terminal
MSVYPNSRTNCSADSARTISSLRAKAAGLEVALALAEACIPLFPCSRKKSPLTEHGFKDATTDLAVIRAWWARWPEALVGVPMGHASGLFAVDLDVDRTNGELTGAKTLEALGISISAQPCVARTRSGGLHIFYRHRPGLPKNSVKQLEGVDIRSEGGYVIAWSPKTLIEANGATDLQQPPSALLDALIRAKAKPHGGEADTSTFPSVVGVDDGSRAWAAAALDQEINALRATQEGGRNNALNRASFSLGQIVAGGHLDRGRVEQKLQEAALHIGLEKEEAKRTIKSGLDSGMVAPRGPTHPLRDGNIGPFRSQENELWPEPDWSLLVPHRAEPPEFPAGEVFDERWANWIWVAAEAKGAPPDYVAGGLVGVGGALLGNARWITPWQGWAEPPILWPMIIGAPSANKSPGLDAVLEAVRVLQRDLSAKAEQAHKEWVAREETSKLAEAAWREAYKAAIKNKKPPPEKPSEAHAGSEPHTPRLIVNDVTIERLAELVSKQPRGAFVFRDELAGLLGNMSRYAGGGSDQPIWLEAYGGRSYVAERMSRKASVERFTVGLMGGIQPDKLASLLLRADDDGMLARFLPIWPKLAPIKRPDRGADVDFAERAFGRLHQLDMPTDEDGLPVPRFVPFSDDARSMIVEFMRWARREEDGEAGLLVSFIGKCRGFAVRLALVLAYLEWAAGDAVDPPEEITLVHLGRACHLVAEYFLPMARRAYAEAAVPNEERAARALALLVHREQLEEFSIRDVTRRERQGLRRKAEVEPALDVLVQAGLIRADQQGSGPKGGRPRLIYRVNPRIWRQS